MAAAGTPTAERDAFRNRFLTPRVARAITSPSGILLAGVGGAAGILLSGPFLGVALGIGAWAARVAAAIPRREEPVDPSTLRPPWRDFVVDTLDAQRRYRQVIASSRGGPLRDRLTSIADRIGDGVRESYRIAQRGMALEGGLRQLDPATIRRDLDAAEAAAARFGGEASQRTVESRRAQLQAAERLSRVTQDAVDRLRLLDARLDEAVARAVELSLSGDADQLTGLGSDVDSVVGDMEALRQALEDTGGTPTAA